MKIPHMVMLAALGLGAGTALQAQVFPGRAVNPVLERTLPDPLTGKQRLLLFGNELYASPGVYAGAGVGAMIDQLRREPQQWGEGGSGYGRRFASEWGQVAVRNGIHDGLAAVAGLDPRYARCACQGVLRRSLHAIEFSVVTYRQDGGLAIDLTQLAGAYGSGILTTYWYPHTQSSRLTQGLGFGHEQVAEIAINHLVREFSGDILRALHRVVAPGVEEHR